MVFTFIGASIGGGFGVKAAQFVLGQVGDGNELVKILQQRLFIHNRERRERRGADITLVDVSPYESPVVIAGMPESIDQHFPKLFA